MNELVESTLQLLIIVLLWRLARHTTRSLESILCRLNGLQVELGEVERSLRDLRQQTGSPGGPVAGLAEYDESTERVDGDKSKALLDQRYSIAETSGEPGAGNRTSIPDVRNALVKFSRGSIEVSEVRKCLETFPGVWGVVREDAEGRSGQEENEEYVLDQSPRSDETLLAAPIAIEDGCGGVDVYPVPSAANTRGFRRLFGRASGERLKPAKLMRLDTGRFRCEAKGYYEGYEG